MPSPDEIDAQTYMYAVAGGYAASQYGTEIEEMQDALSELQRVGAHRKLVAHLELRIAGLLGSSACLILTRAPMCE
jgi:hypothetical protein